MRNSMRRIFVRWIVIGIGILAVSMVFLGLHIMSLQTNRTTQSDVYKKKVLRGNLETKHIRNKMHLTDATLQSVRPLDAGVMKLKENLVKLANEIQRAKIHIRGTKARESLTNAMSLMSELLELTNISVNVTKRKSQPAKNICGEIYKGTTYGYPFFYKGFETQNCSYASPVEKLVTVIFIYKGGDILTLKKILKGISNYNSLLKVIVGTYKDIQIDGNNKYLSFPTTDSDGKIWNSLIQNVQTEYALVARNISIFNIDVRLERLIREIESIGVEVAGGASRDQDGHWKLGCYQSVYKNYTLVLSEGYDESLHECIFCDYVDASFLIRTKILNEFQFDQNMDGVSVFIDFFLRLSQAKLETIVCPDSMFHMQKYLKSNHPNDWERLRHKWQLSQMKLSDEVDITFQCPKTYACFNGLGYAVTPCCLQELADMVNFVMKTCEDFGIICELQEGTLLGAVKLYKVLPWERDADLTFLTANFTEFSKLKKHITSTKKYSYTDDKGSLWCCVDNRTAGGKMKIHSKNWHIELYGQHIMDSEMLLNDGMKPTRLLFNGQWVGVPRNPGWHARNRYGHEIYAHAQHWMATGKSDGWINYKTNQFTPCKKPGRHDCLDNFNADGNLQFGFPIP